MALILTRIGCKQSPCIELAQSNSAFARAGLGMVPGQETRLKRRAVLLEPEITILGVDKQRVGNHALGVVARLMSMLDFMALNSMEKIGPLLACCS